MKSVTQQNMTKVKYTTPKGDKESIWVDDNIVDIMLINDTLRWANTEGTQETADGGRILGLQTEEPWKAVIKNRNGNETYHEVRKVKYEDEMTFISGPGFVDREIGKIVRLRSLKLQ